MATGGIGSAGAFFDGSALLIGSGDGSAPVASGGNVSSEGLTDRLSEEFALNRDLYTGIMQMFWAKYRDPRRDIETRQELINLVKEATKLKVDQAWLLKNRAAQSAARVAKTAIMLQEATDKEAEDSEIQN